MRLLVRLAALPGVLLLVLRGADALPADRRRSRRSGSRHLSVNTLTLVAIASGSAFAAVVPKPGRSPRKATPQSVLSRAPGFAARVLLVCVAALAITASAALAAPRKPVVQTGTADGLTTSGATVHGSV